MARLELHDRQLHALVSRASAGAQRTVSTAVARAALDYVGETSPVLRAAAAGVGAAADVADIVQRLDEAAWDLQDPDDPTGDDPRYEAAFRRARAANAALMALEPDPCVAALEATYEAIAALGADIDAVRHVVHQALAAYG